MIILFDKRLLNLASTINCVAGTFTTEDGTGISTDRIPVAFAMLFIRFSTILLLLLVNIITWSDSTVQPKAPNFQYFERPKYRYPYYDSEGRGKLLYGYGGSELYQYKSYSPLEGVH